MKKYTPTVKNNNAIKEKLVQDIKVILYKIEKGKYGESLNKETIQECYDTLKSSYDGIENVIFTGDEDLSSVSQKIEGCIDNLKKSLDGNYNNRAVEALDELSYYLDAFCAISNGSIEFLDEESSKDKKLSWSKKRLFARLEELGNLKEAFSEQDKRLEREIKELEKDLAELDDKMLAEENERAINELYRKISAAKSKIDMLNVRRSNYSACFNLLDIVYANANEILVASEFSVEEIAKAKVLLNLNKLKAVVTDPDKALAILKAMEKEIKVITDKVKKMDEKIFGLDTQQTSVTDSALAYKEELMRKKREKELNSENLDDLSECAKNIIKTKENK